MKPRNLISQYSEYIDNLKKAKTDVEIANILDKLYNIGFEDGIEDSLQEKEEYGTPMPWEDLD